MDLINRNGYIAGSRILTHVVFWSVYYITFSLLWAEDGNYYRSFGLEFVLMPLRILGSYLSMYFLIPKFLLKERLFRFILAYLLLIVVVGFLQRIFIFYYYEILLVSASDSLWDVRLIIRAMVLVNSTVLMLSAFKMYQYWRIERTLNQPGNELIEVRAEKRNYRIRTDEILFIEGLGNYITYYLKDQKRLISYSSLKDAEQLLPSSFLRIHKSFIINKNAVTSYTQENVDIGGRILPLGKSIVLEFD